MKETKFKQTEVGMIPSDWEVKPLGELFDFSAGGDLQKACFSEYPSGTIKWPIYSNSLENKGLYGYTSNPRYKANCVTVTGRGSLGHAEYRHEAFDAIVRLLVLSPKQHVDCYFVAEIINFRVPFVFESTGVPQLTAPQAAQSKISLPPTIEEQQRIANALSDVDTLINNLEKLIAKKKNIKQGAMQQLLTGKKRLPGFAPAKPTYKQTELGKIPSDWEVKTFGELFDMCTANIPIKDVNQDFYVGTENMLQNKMGVVKNTAVLPYSKVREYQKNDILVSNIRPYLKKIWFADKNGGCSTDVLVFRVKDKNQSPSFLYNVVADDHFFNIVNENAIGTKMPRGDKNVIKQILFAVPPSKDEQTAIANVLSDMDTEISALETKLAKYRKLKTGMMQQLLTGKIRLV